MNCKNVVIAGFNSGANLLNQYLTPISEIIQSLDTNKSHNIIISSPE